MRVCQITSNKFFFDMPFFLFIFTSISLRIITLNNKQ